MFSATLTSKGQITIPKEVRNFFHLNTGDLVMFHIDEKNKKVYIDKHETVAMCQICHGSGSLNGYSCPICNSQGLVRKNISAWEELSLFLQQGVKQEIETTIDHSATGKPTIKLKSPCYPAETLVEIEKYFNEKLGREKE